MPGGYPCSRPPAPLGDGSGTGSACLQGGKASLPAAATPEVLVGGVYATAAAAARSSSPMLQVPAVNPSLCLVVARFTKCALAQLLAPASCPLTDHHGLLSPCP